MNGERWQLGYGECIARVRGIVHKMGEFVGVGFDFQGEIGRRRRREMWKRIETPTHV